MTTYFTGNPVPSTAIKDLFDNAQNLDDLVNGPLLQYLDRKGAPRRSWKGMEVAFQNFLAESGYVFVGDYALGVTFTDRNQFTIRSGISYRPASTATLPLVLTGVWATDAPNLIAFESRRLNVKDFGARSDGVAGVPGGTDNTAFFQEAVTYALANGFGEIIVPRGVYWFAKASPSLDLGMGNIKFIGEGRFASVLYWDGGFDNDVTSPNAKALFKNVANTAGKGDVVFEGIGFRGTWDTDPRNGGGSAHWLDYYNNVTFRDCWWGYCANICHDIHFCQSFVSMNNTFTHNARDCIRCRDTPNCHVTGNFNLRNGDDFIALHMSDASIGTWPVRSQMYVAGNHGINSGTIRALGGRRIVVTGNTLRWPNLIGIDVGIIPTFPEGNIPMFDVTITDNIISDPVSVISGTPTAGASGIIVRGFAPKGAASTNGTIPGRYDATLGAFRFPWNFADVEADSAANPNPPATGIHISGNTCRRTAPAVGAFSSYGFGSRIFGGVAYDPAMTDAVLRYNTALNILSEGLRNAVLSRNILSHALHGIHFAAPTSNYGYTNVKVHGNIVEDVTNTGFLFDTGTFTVDVEVYDNTFDCDVYRQHANSNIDGTYDANLATPSGVNIGNISGLKLVRNAFKNVCNAIQTNLPNNQHIQENLLYAGTPVALGFNVGNKGIGVMPAAGDRYRYVIIEADPTSANFGLLTTMQVGEAAAMPSAGTWVRGAFVRNSAPTKDGSNMTPIGWIRLTTGSAHVSGTDWAICNASHVSPAT